MSRTSVTEPCKESMDRLGGDTIKPLRTTTVEKKLFKQIFPELKEQSEERKIKRSIIFSSLAAKKDLWENKTTAYKERQSINVFSGQFNREKDEKIDAAHYGKAPEGSRTEERAKEASAWVDNEIAKLVSVIKRIGTPSSTGKGSVTVTFGVLFDAYTDISDTLVGILMRAKKRNILDYPGQMLYQGASNEVKITLL